MTTAPPVRAPQSRGVDLLVRAALGRSAVYQLLSGVLGEPADALPGASDPARVLLADLASALPASVESILDRLLASIDGEDAAAFARAHLQVFTHTRSADCPQYELAYRRAHVFQETQEIADLNGFYRAFGLNTGGTRRERADHVAVEIEFLHTLSWLEALAQGEGHTEHIEVTGQAYRHFLRDHALAWMPAFATLLERRAAGESAVLHACALLLAALLESEGERLQLEVSFAPVEPAFSEPLEEDSCPLADTCGVFSSEV